VNALEEFLASLRRLFDFRTRPPAEHIGAPTSDRPPPQEPPVPALEVSSTEPVLEDIPTAVEDAVTDVPQVTRDAEAVAEIRALLEAMAEPPVATPEPLADVSPATEPVETAAPLEESAAEEPAAEEPAAEVSEPSPVLVEGTLVLTLQARPATFTIARSTAMLGRGEDNTIRLEDLSVSRRHARIVYRRSSYWLSDLGSMGGTWVNGSRLAAPHEIALGDIIDIGHCRLTVSYAGDAPKVDGPKAASRRPARR
jgi:hypothetical protein